MKSNVIRLQKKPMGLFSIILLASLISVMMLLVFSMVGCGMNTGYTQTAATRQAGGPAPLQAHLNWQSVKGEQQGFNIEESTDGVNFTKVQVIADGTNTASVLVPKAGNYYFRISAYNQAGVSPYTNIVQVTIQ